MLDAQIFRTQADMVKQKIATKGADPTLVDRFVELDASWRELTTELEGLRTLQKQYSDAREVEKAKENREAMKVKEVALAEVESERTVVWRAIPNLPSDDTPLGKDDSENVVLRTWGEPKQFSFEVKDHMALGESLGLIDTSKASEVSGARFAYLLREAALLEFALVQFTFRTLTDPQTVAEIAQRVSPQCSAVPFVPVVPPVMIRPQVFRDMARLDAATEDERYYFPKDDLYLVGSAEHTLGPLHMGETIPAASLPIRYIGFSTAFRREAGSYGKDTRGILRVHQFDKLEMESFTAPEDGLREQDFFVAAQEYLTEQLGIPYRVVMCCTGDQGDPDARHLDLEMWMPAQNTYRETHSADFMGDYQSRRLRTKVKYGDGSSAYVHTNDATAFAIGRTLIAIMENYQQEDGSIVVPEVLRPYVGTDRIARV